jgi:hypothetical protein
MLSWLSRKAIVELPQLCNCSICHCALICDNCDTATFCIQRPDLSRSVLKRSKAQ